VVWLAWLYALALLLMALFGFNLIVLTALAALGWRRVGRPAPVPAAWPAVLVQLPLFNERYVVERLIDAAAALDYPAERLTIQVLDDSTDDTLRLARARAAWHRARGRAVEYIRRPQRDGFKAGALAAGLARSSAEFVAVFDADFLPPADFLRRAVPELCADAGLGCVQARWEHLNADDNSLTRAEALALDSHFAVDQMARSRSGLFLNFNGSAGVWRRAAIESAGGWQGDTIAEDLDLSYRAQLAGWRIGYRPEITAPAELPTSIMAFKQQQFRWAKGSFQVLRKLGPRLLRSEAAPLVKLEGLLHIGGYLPHPLMLLTLLLSLPVVLMRGQLPLNWSALGLAGLGPVLAAVFAQVTLRRDAPRRLLYFPAQVLMGAGLALTNARALWEATFGGAHDFVRTPKNGLHDNGYALPADWTTWAELALAVYALATGLLALDLAPGLAVFLFIYALGLGYTSGLGLWQSGGARRAAEETL
jgi:hypothetical protein